MQFLLVREILNASWSTHPSRCSGSWIFPPADSLFPNPGIPPLSDRPQWFSMFKIHADLRFVPNGSRLPGWRSRDSPSTPRGRCHLRRLRRGRGRRFADAGLAPPSDFAVMAAYSLIAFGAHMCVFANWNQLDEKLRKQDRILPKYPLR